MPGGSLLVPTWDGRHILSGALDKDYPLSKEYVKYQPPNFVVVNSTIESFPLYVREKLPKKVQRDMDKVFFCVSSEEELEIIESFRTLEALGINPLDYEISPLLEQFFVSFQQIN